MNSSKKSAIVQVFTINKSPLLLQFLIITHSLAAFASLTNALPWIYKLIALITVGLSLFLSLRRYHYCYNPYCIRYNKASNWQLAITKADFQTLTILPSSVITVWLMVLHVRVENGNHYNLVIMNDALIDQNYRALAVTLKIAEPNQQAGQIKLTRT